MLTSAIYKGNDERARLAEAVRPFLAPLGRRGRPLGPVGDDLVIQFSSGHHCTSGGEHGDSRCKPSFGRSRRWRAWNPAVRSRAMETEFANPGRGGRSRRTHARRVAGIKQS